MAVEAVPASSSRRLIVGARWFQLVVRGVLALLALWALVLADDRYLRWRMDFNAFSLSATGLWLSWVGATVAVGFLFGLAAWLPFTRVRYEWIRLLLAAVALVPVVQFWLIFLVQLDPNGVPARFLSTADWLMDPNSVFVLAALAGVAIASGFRAKDSTSAAG
jgi:hypothetical protein